MNKKLVDTLIPEYIKEFSCIGAACEDTCCAGWRVNIDEETYKKYKKVKEFNMRSRLDKNIIRNRSNPTKNNVAKMKMINGKCSLLTEEGWCGIQSELGEEYLCNTCAEYPRINNKVNGILEQSLTVSCPEATRLVLLNKNGIDFEQRKKEVTIRDFMGILDTSSGAITHWKDLFNEYRYITIFILQNRSYSLEERLLILGLLYNEIEECIKGNNLTAIPEILGRYLKLVEENLLKGEFSNITGRSKIQLRLIREVALLRLNEGISSSRYLECSRAMISGLKIDDLVTDEEIIEIYESSYEKYYAPFMEEHDYLLENYLVNYVFKICMPMDCTSPFESFSRMILHYSLIKLHLIGMANYYEGLSVDLVIKLVQSLSKTFEHYGDFFQKTMKLIKDNDFLSLTYMSILIKN